MGTPSAENTQNAITQQQVATENNALNLAQQQYTQSQAEIAPAVNYYTQLTSGNPSAVMSADAQNISAITGGYSQAVENINNNVAPGAARDYALSQVPIQQNSQVASSLNSTVQNAYGSLAALGSGSLGASEQFTGAGISAGNSASSSNQAVLQAQEQSASSLLGIFGSLIGAGGTALGGGTLAKILGL